MAKKSFKTTINSSSMADIAFLLLIFFLVTTMFSVDQGLPMQLPPKVDVPVTQNIPEHEILQVLLNSQDQLMVNGDRLPVEKLAALVQDHVINYGKSPRLSSDPKKAIVSIKADRGTSYAAYLAVLDAVEEAYNGLYAEKLNISLEEFRVLDRSSEQYQYAKRGMPRQVSIAEPTDFGG